MVLLGVISLSQAIRLPQNEATLAQTGEKIPDYDDYYYSGAKHWLYTNDPYFANPDEYVDDAPAGYDDFVHDESVAQTQSENMLGVTFLPGHNRQRLVQSYAGIPDYWSYEFSPARSWEYAINTRFSDPDDYIEEAPYGYTVDSLSQVGRRTSNDDDR